MSTKSTTIEITDKLIQCGVPRRADRCPLAIALRVAFPAYFWLVNVHGAKAFKEGQMPWDGFQVALPESAVNFITAFDGSGIGGEEVKPFSFEIATPP